MSRRPTLAWLVLPTLLTVVAATAAAAPAAAAATRTAASTVDYVALGDSYATAIGAPGAAGLCGRGSRAYPALWAAANDPASFRSVACGGATTDDVRRTQLTALSSRTDLVTLTVGGNDAGFAPTVISCTVGGDAACTRAVQAARDYATRLLPARLDATYRAVRQRAPNATVVVLGYPRLFDAAAGCGSGGLSAAKRRALNAGADELAGVIAGRAAAAGFVFADVRAGFDAHGVCSRDPWINGFSLLSATNSYHPTTAGYAQGYLPALAAAVAD